MTSRQMLNKEKHAVWRVFLFVLRVPYLFKFCLIDVSLVIYK